MKFAFSVTRLASWARNSPCLICLMVCNMDWTCRTHRKVTAELPKRQALQGSCFTEEPARILQDTEESNSQILPVQGRTVLQISFFTGKFAKYYGHIGSRWIPQHFKRTLGDNQDHEMSRSFLEIWNLLTMHLLFT